ncbi:hypothetical protein AAC387_Pa08g0010 [Persea americana]
MHSQREAVGTLVSSIVSQVLAILVLLPSSSSSASASSSSSSSSPPPFPFLSSLLSHHLSFLLLFLTTTTTTTETTPDTTALSDSSFISQSPPLSPPSPSRKRKRRPPNSEDNNPNRTTQQQQEDCGGEGPLFSSSSSSSSSSIRNHRDDAVCNTSSPFLPLSLSEDTSSFNLFFRMTSATFEWLSGLLEPLLECRDPVGSSLNLSPNLRLGIGLFRLATGSPYPDISRRFSVSEPTARFCTKQLCRVLCTNFRFWVAFPNPSELRSVSAAFQALTGLPNCCGAIECTRFETRRGESVAAQIVVDSASRILNIATGFRGRRHKDEPAVLRSSALYKDVQGGHLLNSPPAYLEGVAIPQYLIGGNAYPLLPWLMVPFAHYPTHHHHHTSASASTPSSSGGGEGGDDFNVVHQSARGPALRTLASLRNWGILSRPIEEEEMNMAVACIGACSILHNVLLMREDFSALSDAHPMDDRHSLHDWRSRPREESSSGETSTDKACDIRNALAARARENRADLNQRNEHRHQHQ